MGKSILLQHLRDGSSRAKRFAQGLVAKALEAAAADVEALQNNKQDKLSGQPGQVLIFDGEGNLSADDAHWLGAFYEQDGLANGYDASGQPIYDVRGISFAGENYPDGEEQVLLVRKGNTLDLENGILCTETPDEDNSQDDDRNVVNKRYLRNMLANFASTQYVDDLVGRIAAELAAINGEEGEDVGDSIETDVGTAAEEFAAEEEEAGV